MKNVPFQLLMEPDIIEVKCCYLLQGNWIIVPLEGMKTCLVFRKLGY